MMPCKQGLGWIENKDGSQRLFKDAAAVMRYGVAHRDDFDKRYGFHPSVWTSEEYFRLSYGKKC